MDLKGILDCVEPNELTPKVSQCLLQKVYFRLQYAQRMHIIHSKQLNVYAMNNSFL